MERELYCNNQMTTGQMGRFEYHDKFNLVGSVIFTPFIMILFGILLYAGLKDRKRGMSICFGLMLLLILMSFIFGVIGLIKINQNPYDYFCV